MNTPFQLPRRARQAGFTLVEMLVAITIGLVVLIGMTSSFIGLKNTFRSQDKLGQLQDNERLASTFLTNSINEAGYYPDPKSASPLAGGIAPATTPASPGGTMPVAVGVFGTADGGTPTTPESLQTSYGSVSTDGLLSCIGTSYAGTGTVSVRNIYYVDPTTNSLMCRVLVNNATSDAMANGGTPQVLVTGISKMLVWYGLTTTGDSQVATYVAVGSMATTDWPNVKAVRIILTFVNPFDSTTPITRTQTINVMN